MEKKIINEVNRNLTIMGLDGNLIIEAVSSEAIESIGRIALRLFKQNISKTGDKADTLKGLLRGKVDDGFLDNYPKFWEYVNQGQRMGEFGFSDDNEVYGLINAILKVDSGYFPIIFRNVLRRNGQPINFDQFISAANATKIDNMQDAISFLHNTVSDIGGVNQTKFVEFFLQYVKQYKTSNVFISDLPKFSNGFTKLLQKFDLTKNWGLAFESMMLASKTTQERLLTNIKIRINNAAAQLKEPNSNEEKIYKDLYKDIERYFSAFYMKESQDYGQILESFKVGAPDELNKVVDNIISGIKSPSDNPNGMRAYSLIDALSPSDKKGFFINLQLKFGYSIVDSLNSLPKKRFSEEISSIVDEILAKKGVKTLAKKAIPKAFNARVTKTFLFGALPNRQLILKYLSDSKLFQDETLAGPATKKIYTYLRAYFTIQFYSLMRKVLVYGYIPLISGTIKTLWDTDGSIELRNFLGKNANKIMGKNYVNVEYTNKNGFPMLVEYVWQDYKNLFKWVISSNTNTFGAFTSATIKNIILPASILSTTEAFIWKNILYPIITKLNINKGFENFDYSEFIDNLIGNEIKKNKEQLDTNNPELEQAGGGEIDVNNKTWSFSSLVSQFPNRKIVEINFPLNKTQKVIINNKYNLVNKDFMNIKNNVGINVPNSITITSMKLVDNKNATHSFQKK